MPIPIKSNKKRKLAPSSSGLVECRVRAQKCIKDALKYFEGEWAACNHLIEKGNTTKKFPVEEYVRGRVLSKAAISYLHIIERALLSP